MCDIDTFNNSSHGRFACRPFAFDVFSQIHKYRLHSLLKNVDSNATVKFPTFLALSATVGRYFNSISLHLFQLAVFPPRSHSLVVIKAVGYSLTGFSTHSARGPPCRIWPYGP